MRRLVHQPGTRFFKQGLQALLSTVRLGRQKALEGKPVRRHTGSAQRSNQGAGARHRRHLYSGFAGLTHQMKARIGNQRRTGVGDQGDVITGQHPLDQPLPLVSFVVVMTGGHGSGDAKVLHETRTVAGILRSDQTDIPQHLQRAGCQVLQITDGRGNHKQGAGSDGHGDS